MDSVLLVSSLCPCASSSCGRSEAEEPGGSHARWESPFGDEERRHPRAEGCVLSCLNPPAMRETGSSLQRVGAQERSRAWARHCLPRGRSPWNRPGGCSDSACKAALCHVGVCSVLSPLRAGEQQRVLKPSFPTSIGECVQDGVFPASPERSVGVIVCLFCL